MIVNVTVGTMGSRRVVPANTETATPAQIFADAGVDITNGQPSLDGMTLRVGEMNQTLDELHIAKDCFLSCIVKADSAC